MQRRPFYRSGVSRTGVARSGIAWLELLLGLAILLLVLQLVPALGKLFLYAMDVRNWPRTVWFAANIVIVAALLSIRFGPDLIAD